MTSLQQAIGARLGCTSRTFTCLVVLTVIACGGTVQACPTVDYLLTVNIIGSGTVQAEPGGHTFTGTGGVVSFSSDTTFTLTPIPAQFWHFDHWEEIAYTNPVQLPMVSNITLTAVFKPGPGVIAIEKNPSSPDPTSGATVMFDVTFSENVTGVGTDDFQVDVRWGALTGAYPQSVSGSGSHYTVTANTGTGSGDIGLKVIDNDSIVSTSPLGGAGAGNGDYTSECYFYVDKTPPVVTSIKRQTGSENPTYASSVQFRVQFSKGVTGVDTTDFRITTTGSLNTTSITSVSGSSGSSTYTVTADTGAGSGCLWIWLCDNNSINDQAQNPYGGLGLQHFLYGERYICRVSNQPASDTTNPDGDGFQNCQEWNYLRRYYLTESETWDKYGEYIFDNYLYPATSGTCIEDVEVVIHIVGQGTVDPGPGKWNFARYALDSCSNPCPSGTCGYNQLTFTAVPAAGWAFRRWYGVNIEESYEPGLTITTNDAYGIHAEFIQRNGLQSLDLLADLQSVLTLWNISTSIQQFDVNAIAPDEDANPISAPNGIPDAAELYLLQSVLKDVYFSLAESGGASHDTTWITWQNNLQQAQLDLPTQAPEIQRVVAAYMTLGNDGSVMWAEEEINARCAITISGDNYDLTTREFTGDKDADNDGTSNLDEWNGSSGEDWGDSLSNFASNASNGEQTVPPGDPSGGSSGGGGDDECDEECLAFSPVTVAGFPLEGGEAVLLPEPGSYRRGQMMGVDAVANQGYEFSCWVAAGTMIDYSEDQAEKFSLMGSASPTALFTRTCIAIPNNTQNYSITASSNATPGTDSDGLPVLYGKPSEEVTLTASVPDNAPEGTRVFGWKVSSSRGSSNWMCSWTSSIITRFGGYAVPCTTTDDPDTSIKLWSASADIEPPDAGCIYSGGVQSGDWAYGVYPGGISCPESYSAVLTAEANEGYVFDRWEWANGSDTNCTKTFSKANMPADLKAIFKKGPRRTLSISVDGCGWVDSDIKRKYFADGDHVVLTAHPAACQCNDNCCSGFKGWTSTANGHILWGTDQPIKQIKTPELHVTIDGDTSVTAVFSEAAKAGNETARSTLLQPMCGEIPEGMCVPEMEGEQGPVKDDCGNVLCIICNGTMFHLCYNGHPLSNCEYPQASNGFYYIKTGSAGERFSRIIHINVMLRALDPPLVWDEEGQCYRVNWEYAGEYKVVEYNCITCRMTKTYYISDQLPGPDNFPGIVKDPPGVVESGPPDPIDDCCFE